MKLAVFGAIGGTGHEVVQQALDAGHVITVLVRDPSRLSIQHPRLNVVTGDALDPTAVEQTIAGADAVISTLGPSRKLPTPHVMAESSKNIVDAMKKQGVRRLIILTGAGVPDPGDSPPRGARQIMLALLKLISGSILEDAIRGVENVRASALDWTVVRVPRLAHGPKRGSYNVGYLNPGFKPIMRADAAEFILKQLTDRRYVRQAPMMSYE